ncbi:MAG: glycerol-3-phosphate dehydrogenase/oxidase [Dehalococcoidia bacterium]|jgi:glycerol-3-phosphate dehydrogenase
MQQNIEEIFRKIKTENWDLIIIGGGITGAGILREAVRRNVKALLVEQRDFAWGASSRTGQLVHGGLRYLKQGDVKLTYHSVCEREMLLKELPGLVNPFGMMMAIYREGWLQRVMVQAALLVYDIMSRKLRKHTHSIGEMIKRFPGIRELDLECGLLFYESLTDDARLVLRILQQAEEEGGIAVNYCQVIGLLKENDRVCGVALEDKTTGNKLDVYAKQVINATGAWADILRGSVRKTNTKRMRPLRGSHLVFSADRLPVSESIVITHPTSKRPGFVFPWEGRVITGDTDIDHTGDLNIEASITPDEIDYMLENVQYYFPHLDITRKDIIAVFSGIRPVVGSGKKDPSKESRDHVVWQEDGLLTVTGGKLTTFRLLALDALKAAQPLLGQLPDLDKKQPVFPPLKDVPTNSKDLKPEILLRLQGRYGNRAKDLIDGAKTGELEKIPGTATLWAELRFAAHNEAVVHLEDLMLRRTRIALLLENGGKAILPKIRAICQPLLGWDDEKWCLEEENYLETWQHFYSAQ